LLALVTLLNIVLDRMPLALLTLKSQATLFVRKHQLFVWLMLFVMEPIQLVLQTKQKQMEPLAMMEMNALKLTNVNLAIVLELVNVFVVTACFRQPLGNSVMLVL
jgi:hypothetical protein